MGRFAKVHVFRNDNLQQCLNVDPSESAFTKTKGMWMACMRHALAPRAAKWGALFAD